GETVNLAARLQGSAAPGTVLVDRATRRAVGTLFSWGEPLELELKGIAGPVDAWPVVGTRAGGRRQRGVPGVEAQLVGRTRELRVRVGLRRRLEQHFGAAAADDVYPYLGGLLDLALEHDAAAKTAELSPEALQWRTHEVVAELFARLADESPLVLALEDLHWS